MAHRATSLSLVEPEGTVGQSRMQKPPSPAPPRHTLAELQQ